MNTAHCIGLSIIVAATLFSMGAIAQQTCPATPEKYRKLEFGDVRFAIEESRGPALTQTEQFLVAGIAQKLLSDCKLPRHREARVMVERFNKATTLALSFRKPDGPLRESIAAQSEGAAAFASGTSMMEKIPCNGPQAALLSRGIVIYLKRTSGTSRFVTGCAQFYKGRYNEKQCRCIAENLRAILPDVDQRYFDREIIKEGIHQSPFIALPLMYSCGVGNY